MTTNKRIGTFTLGISLCYIGITLVLSLFVNLNIILLLVRLFPLMLVVLGLELILYTAQKKEEKLKYDGISIFLILLFCFGAMGAAAAGWGIQTYQSSVLQKEWYDFFNQAFKIYPYHVSELSSAVSGFLA